MSVARSSCVVLFLALVVLLLAGSEVHGHICLMIPAQRGGFNVSDPGDISCFQPQGPCGTVAPANPQVTLQGGSGFAVFLQQNLNHYNPGWPGFLDVAWAMGPNPASSAFRTLATIPDYWPHLQAQQTNFSVVVQVPNIDCPRCTLRVRYNPNKPTEPVFHNCADIKIVKSTPPPKFGRLFGIAQYDSFGETFLVEIGLDGSLSKVSSALPVRLATPNGAPAVTFTGFANGLVSIDPQRQLLYFLGYSDNDTLANDNKPSTYVAFDANKGQFVNPVAVTNPTSDAFWVATVPNLGSNTYPSFILELVNVRPNGWKFQARRLDNQGRTTGAFTNFPYDNTFVNYFWGEYDHVRNKLYVLSGDENSLFELNVRLYVVDGLTGAVSYVSVDNSQYTVTSIHVDVATGNVYALSPGLYPQQTLSWSLVQIDPSSGRVTLIGNLGSDQLGDYYGGGVYGASIVNGNTVLHQFQQTQTGSTVLNMIDLATGSIKGSTAYNTGVNGAIKLNTVVYLPPM